MQKIQHYTLIALFVICSACQNRETNIKNKELTYIHIDSLVNENLIIKNMHRHRFLPLETTQESLIAHIEKIEFDDDKIFIFDSNNRLFVFDENGRFLNTIGQIGQGPDEHRSMVGFYLDRKNKRVNIIDVFRMKIFSYSYEGVLKDRICIARHQQIFDNSSRAYLLDNNTLLLEMGNSPQSLYNFSLLSGRDFRRAEKNIPYLFVGSMSIRQRNRVAHNENDTFLTAMISDTIYRYDPKTRSIIPYMVFKGRYRPMTTRDIGRGELETGLDALRTARTRRLSFGIGQIMMTNRHLHFTFNTHNGSFRVLWDMTTNRGYISERLLLSEPSVEAILNNYFGRLNAVTNNAFVSSILAYNFTYDVVRNLWKEYEPAREILETILEDDNPVLIFYYID